MEQGVSSIVFDDELAFAELEVTKWATWKVTLSVVLFSGAFWVGAIYIISRLSE